MTKRTCSIEGCSGAHHARGWCSTHLARWRKKGDPHGPLKTPPGLPLRTLMDWLATRDRAECWLWPFGASRYGTIRHPVTGKNSRVHRVAYELDRGFPLVDYGCHTCDQPMCCNPDHIFDGTNKLNQLDAASKGRSARKLDPEQVLAIRKDPRTSRAIAADYGIGNSQVSLIKRREAWQWLADAG